MRGSEQNRRAGKAPPVFCVQAARHDDRDSRETTGQRQTPTAGRRPGQPGASRDSQRQPGSGRPRQPGDGREPAGQQSPTHRTGRNGTDRAAGRPRRARPQRTETPGTAQPTLTTGAPRAPFAGRTCSTHANRQDGESQAFPAVCGGSYLHGRKSRKRSTPVIPSGKGDRESGSGNLPCPATGM